MTKPVIVLNSGGFDSTMLLNYVNEIALNEKRPVYSLFFDHGQLSVTQESSCARKNAESLGMEHREIKIPKLYWTKSDFYKAGGEFNVDKQYLEMRNLIFLSYALSLAESVGADKIYLAVLKSHHGYKDTSPEFIQAMNEVSKRIGVEVEAPFSDCDKFNLIGLAYKYGITEKDFHSCDTPNNDGSPCGKCGDCLEVAEVMKELELKTPQEVYYSPNGTDEMYRKSVIEAPVKELRVSINNRCQFKCAHCFYGFDKSYREDLRESRLTQYVADLQKELGFKSVHYCGKEPMIDGSMFNSIRTLKKILPADMEYSVVTNGLTIPDFYQELVEEKLCDKVFISIDDLDVITSDEEHLRNSNKHIMKAVNFLVKNEVPTQVFVDMHNGNIHQINELLFTLVNSGLREFFLRVIMPIGSAKNIDLPNVHDISKVFAEVRNLSEYYTKQYKDFHVWFNVGINFIKDVFNTEPQNQDEADFIEACYNNRDLNTNYVHEGMTLITEYLCSQFGNTLTLTSDGYVLGCASAVSCDKYYEHAAFDIETPLSEVKSLLTKAREKTLSYCDYCNSVCPFSL